MKTEIPVLCESEDFEMLPNGDILGVKAYAVLIGEKASKTTPKRKHKNRARKTDMKVGFALVRSGVYDF